MNSATGEANKDYKTVRRVGIWSTWLLWLQVVLLPLVVLAPYFLNKNTITIKGFLVVGVIDVSMAAFMIIVLIVKGEALKHPEDIPVSQIRRDTNWLAWPALVFSGIGLILGGHVGLVWILYVLVVARAKQVARNYEKMGRQYVSRQTV